MHGEPPQRIVSSGLVVAKGHGTGNDFVLLWDPQGQVEVSAGLVAALCDRQFGVGADGFIRAVRCEHAGVPDLKVGSNVEWFMDYRNHDGSVAQMCGNGIRVFASYLAALGGITECAAGVPIATRSGVKTVYQESGVAGRPETLWRVHMGHVAPASSLPVGALFDVEVSPRGSSTKMPGLRVNVGNPHVVVPVASLEELAQLDLTAPPVVHGTEPDSANVEFVLLGPVAEAPGKGVIRLRVHERGVGETLSCGTGACAAAFAGSMWHETEPVQVWTVHLPGGALTICVEESDVWMTGPATLVADVQVSVDAMSSRHR